MSSNTTASSSASVLRGKDTFRFLDLCTELRCQVYEHFVVVGKVFYTPDDYAVKTETRFKDCTLYKAPELQILRVCKQIHVEAEDMYLSKNLFVLPDFFMYHAPMNSRHVNAQGYIPFAKRPLFSAHAKSLLRHVSVSINSRLSAPNLVAYEDYSGKTPEERLDLAHRHTVQDHVHYLSEAMASFGTFLAHTMLQSMEIDVTNAYCPLGCCRAVTYCAGTIFDLDADSIAIIGLKAGEEDEVLRNLFRKCVWTSSAYDMPCGQYDPAELQEQYMLEFDPEDRWAEWKMTRQVGKADGKEDGADV
jgi:hypothetical protein